MKRARFLVILTLILTSAALTQCVKKPKQPGDELSAMRIEGPLLLQRASVVDAAEALRDRLVVSVNVEEIEYDPSTHGISLQQALSELESRAAGDRLLGNDSELLDVYRNLSESGMPGESIVTMKKKLLGGPQGSLDLSDLSLSEALGRITRDDSDYAFEFNPAGCTTLFPSGETRSMLDGQVEAMHASQTPIQDLMAEDGPVGSMLAERGITILWSHPLFLDNDLPVTLQTGAMPLRDLLCVVSRATSPPLAWTLAGIRGLRVLAFEPLIPDPAQDDEDPDRNGPPVVIDDEGKPIKVKLPCVYQAPPPPAGDFQASPSANCNGTLRVPNNRSIEYQAVNETDIDRGNAACVPRNRQDTFTAYRWRYRFPRGQRNLRGRTVRATSPRRHNRNVQMTLRLDDRGVPANDPLTQVADKRLLSTVPDRDPGRLIGPLNCRRRQFGRGDSYGGTVSFNGCPQVPYEGSTVRERRGAIAFVNNCNFRLPFRTGGPGIPIMAGNQYGTQRLADRLYICSNRDTRIIAGGCTVAFSTQWTIQRDNYIRHRNSFSIPGGNSRNGGGFNALTTTRVP